MGTAIRPPFRLYTLRVEACHLGSPAVRMVRIVEEDEGRVVREHSITPAQARTLANDLVVVAGPAPSLIVTTERLDALAHMVCQRGGHIPNRDRSLPGSCGFHARMAIEFAAALGIEVQP